MRKTHPERVWNPLIDGSDHAIAVARLSELMDMDLTAGSAEEAEFELLVLLIQSYEQTKFPPAPPDPDDTTDRTTEIGRKMV